MGIGDPIDTSVLEEDEEARRLERSVAARPADAAKRRHDDECKRNLPKRCETRRSPDPPSRRVHSPLQEEGNGAGQGRPDLHLATTEDLEQELARRQLHSSSPCA
jgi:hypothetical protein